MISIIIPAKNEAHRIRTTVKDYVASFPEAKLVIALSQCTDDTEKIVKELQSEFPDQIYYLLTPPTKGNSKGLAVRSGFSWALKNLQPDFLAFIDADNSVRPSEFRKLAAEKGDYDAVISSRYLSDSYLKERESLLRIMASHFFRRLVKILFRLPYEDTQCGGKIYRAELIKNILPHLKVDDMSFDIEILFILQKQDAAVREVPIVWRENQASTISTSQWRFLSTSVQMFVSLLYIRFRFWKAL